MEKQQSREDPAVVENHNNITKNVDKEDEEYTASDTGDASPPLKQTQSEQEWKFITGIELFLVIGTVTLACFIMLLDTSIVATAIPVITNDFHSLEDVGWYGSAYLISSCSLQPLAGKIYSRFRSKWTFMFYLFVFELGSMIAALANSSNMFIVGRAISGMGGSGIVNGALTIISNCVPLQKRATYLGFMMSFGQIGILIGPLIGGALTQYTTWRWCFWINLPAGGVVAAILFFVTVPERNKEISLRENIKEVLKSLDLPGFALFAPTAIMLLLALEWGGVKYAWDSSRIIGLFCGAGALFIVFLIWEYKKGDEAMIPYSMISIRIVFCSCIVMLFFFGGMMITSYYLAIYFQAVRGVTPTLSGVYLLPTILSQMVTAIVSGILVGKLGYYLPWSTSSGVLTAISSGLISTFTPNTSTGKWIGYQILGGAGRGMGMQMTIIAIQNAIPQKQNSVGMSLVAFFQTFGGALFLAFGQTDFNTGLAQALKKYAPEVSAAAVANAGASGFRKVIAPAQVPAVIQSYSDALNHVFYIAAACAATGTIASLGIGWKSIKKPKTVQPEA